ARGPDRLGRLPRGRSGGPTDDAQIRARADPRRDRQGSPRTARGRTRRRVAALVREPMPHSSKKRGHFRKTEKPPDVVHKKKPTYIPARRGRKERTMEHEKEPHGPPPPPVPPRTPRPTDHKSDPKADEPPKPGRPPHWHEGDPEPEDEEAKHLPPKDEEPKHLPPKDEK